ncbi:beta-1,3-galactosyltransferase 6 [Lingula anatina]|uniref:Hexosyltransferase n=1 Tax=Lingula anatina TaxID=7574 RepID=A0A1S3I6U7_LINAN|nr:beta-1,3-galactosyltransferase 6 [Lingula anatina]XP_013393983.1 beta-1,3-galactosyltransferase 6 [Lingula anatina]XP_013393984.1 beta-1,3-galactosyltransferase 6 [Lingula anatina]XP_013393985.1 beta-1,3-galactosyltransferase 6 [Lingula anatina]|eukprot:XP_013393982.1 beta-1,3-galactosyltransferase 6 [Lingula anatina]
MHATKSPKRFTTHLNRHAPTILICGIFLFFSGLLYMSFCGMPAERSAQSPALGEKNQNSKHVEMHNKMLSAFMVVAILTGRQNRERRDMIRQTWLSNVTKDIVPYFVIGTKDLTPEEMSHLKLENKKTNDLLLLPDVHDAYEKLADKVLQMYIWLDANVHFHYIFKGDDDTFARVDVIAEELKRKKQQRLYWGFFSGRAHVYRRGKWAEKEWVLCDRYLPYALGGGYILSSDLIHYIANSANYLQKFKSEDVSVGAWLAPVELNRVHDTRFDTEYKSRGCSNKYIVTHKQTTELMKQKFASIQMSGRLCKKEVKLRNSYEYDWEALPSQCCTRTNNTNIP